jgi:hypothetical protein
MRFTDFRTLTEEQLDELRMSPSSLKAFINSPEAEGIRAGFEAELIFTGIGGSDDPEDWEPDMDMDERCSSIDEVIDFFGNDEWGYGLSPRGERDLRNGLDEMYMEWHDEQMYDAFRDEAEELIKKVIEDEEWDWDDKTREALEAMGLSEEEVDAAIEAGESAPRYTKLSDQTAAREASKAYDNYLEGREQAENDLQTQAENSLADQDSFYDMAIDEFRNDFYVDDDSSFFSDVGLRWMSDVRDQFDLDWPYMTGSGGNSDGFSEQNAQQLADDLSEVLGVKTKVSGGYHSARRDDVTWIFEPDSSLDADSGDMPVEIVSPPMPIKEALDKMREFFKWAVSSGAYSNRSTGFHMGVSLPYAGGNVDFVKLALFLGDEHVLKEFGRSSNHFTEAAMKKIRASIARGNAKVTDAMELMRSNLIELASRSISKGDFGKYTSINPHQGYIEFRSAGGEEYTDSIDRLENTMMRYAQAMHIASRADLERKEYAKKLYKLIAPEKSDPSLELFAKYTAGTITKEELKKQWAETALAKDAPETLKKSTWQLYDKTTGKPVAGKQYGNFTYDEAIVKAKLNIWPGSSMQDFKKQYELLDTSANTGQWAVVNRETDEIIDIIKSATRGEAADLAMDKHAGVDYYIRSYSEFDTVRKPLSRRAELAKRIKTGPAKDSTVKDIQPDIAGAVDAADRSRSQAPRGDVELYQYDTPNEVFNTLRNVTADEIRDYINQQEANGMPPGFLRVRRI